MAAVESRLAALLAENVNKKIGKHSFFLSESALESVPQSLLQLAYLATRAAANPDPINVASICLSGLRPPAAGGAAYLGSNLSKALARRTEMVTSAAEEARGTHALGFKQIWRCT